MKSGTIPPFVWLMVFAGFAFTLATSRSGWPSALSFVDATIAPETYNYQEQTSLAIPAATPVPGCVTAPSGLVGWWPFDGNGNDFQVENNAFITGSPAFVPGQVAQAMNFDGVTASAEIIFPSSSLNVGAGDGFTIDLWVSPSDLSVPRPLVHWGNTNVLGVHLWQSVTFGGAQGPGNLYASIIDTTGTNHIISSPPNTLVAGQYQHVALTYNKVLSTALLWVNGNLVAGQSFPLFTPQTSVGLRFGERPLGELFIGQMDEIHIFNRSFSTGEIQAIHSAGSSGLCKTRYVTNTIDGSNPDPAGSLRKAISDSNAYPGPDTIYFNIPGSGVHTISPSSALPTIDAPLTIDGTTQPGYAGSPLIELNGASAGVGSNGLDCVAPVAIKGFVINRFLGSGIAFGGGSSGSIIAGNYLGTNASGNATLGNLQAGVVLASNIIVGGTTAEMRNIISGNGYGIAVNGSGNTVLGNYIGTDVTGTLDLGNSSDGVFFNQTDGAGNNTIGGTSVGARNIISGNSFDGIFINSSGNVVQGNYIGTDVTGMQQLGNSGEGIGISTNGNQIGGVTPAARNVISGNFQQGIEIRFGSTQNTIQGNYIGTNAAGTGAIGNGLEGVLLTNGPNNNTIGLDSGGAGVGNTVAFNNGIGVRVDGTASIGNAVRANSIFSNGGLGIDLSPPAGVTPNDPGDSDTGANNLQNFPVLTSAISSGGTTTIQSTFNSAAGTSFRIEFFANSSCDPSGNGEGQAFLGFTNVNTNGSGNAAINIVLPVSVTDGQFITSTATDVMGNTSEFSQCILVTGPTPTQTSTPTPTASPVISGTVTYGNAIGSPMPPRFVKNVSLSSTVGSPSVGPVITGTPGTYTLTGFGAGSYTIKPTKPAGPNAAISSFDAARVAQGVVGSPSFVSQNQRFAADVTGNGQVSSQDAGKIAQFAAGVTPLPAPNLTSEWRFFVTGAPSPLPTPPQTYDDSRTYASVTSNLTGQDYVAILMGDVTGNWNPATHPRPAGGNEPPRPPKRLPPLLNQGGELLGPERSIDVKLPQMTVSTDKEIVIPVSVQGAVDKGVISYEFDLRYDPTVIQPLEIPVDVAGTVSRGLFVVANPHVPGSLRVVVYGPMPIDENGVLLNLRFTAGGTAGSVSPLTLERILFNEGESAITVTDGRVELY